MANEREPTEFELRLARKLFDMTMATIPPHLHPPFDYVLPPILRQLRVLFDELRTAPDDPAIWDAYAGHGRPWKDQSSSEVFRRYLDVISPPVT